VGKAGKGNETLLDLLRRQAERERRTGGAGSVLCIVQAA
jgi:hypothetical protein